jgi:transposase
LRGTFSLPKPVAVIGAAAVVRWVKRSRENGSPAALPMGGKRPFALASQRDWVSGRIREKPDLTVGALTAELAERGVTVSCYGVWHFLKRQGISFKKRMARPVCNGEIGWRVGLHQRIRSQGINPGQDGFRAFQAS